MQGRTKRGVQADTGGCQKHKGWSCLEAGRVMCAELSSHVGANEETRTK